MRGEPSIERLLLDYDTGGYLHSAASTNHALKASIISVMGVFKSVLFINIKMFYKNNIILMENVNREIGRVGPLEILTVKLLMIST